VSPVTAGVLLDAPPALVEGFTGQPNNVEGVHHRNRGGELFAGGGLVAGEPGYRDDLHVSRRAFGRSASQVLKACLERLPPPDDLDLQPVSDAPKACIPSNVKRPFAGSCTASGSGQHQLLAQQPVQTRRPRRLEQSDATGVRHDPAVRRVELNTG